MHTPTDGLGASRFVAFSRDEWSRLRDQTPLLLTEADLFALRGLNDQVTLTLVEQIYLPLARLLNLYVAATQTLRKATDTFLGNQGMRHSDKMRIVERFRLAAPDQLEVQTTITDPEALTKPTARTAVYGRHRDWTLAEYVCQQNNRNFTTNDGKAGIDLSFEEQK